MTGSPFLSGIVCVWWISRQCRLRELWDVKGKEEVPVIETNAAYHWRRGR